MLPALDEDHDGAGVPVLQPGQGQEGHQGRERQEYTPYPGEEIVKETSLWKPTYRYIVFIPQIHS